MAADRLTVHIELRCVNLLASPHHRATRCGPRHRTRSALPPPTSGGLELLFANVRSFDAEVDAPAATMRDLIATLRDRHIKERPELFCVDGDMCDVATRAVRSLPSALTRVRSRPPAAQASWC